VALSREELEHTLVLAQIRAARAERQVSEDHLPARAYPGVRRQRNRYFNEAMQWRALYEELRPFVARSEAPEAETLLFEADRLLRESRGSQ
jgi:hypothetical protein